MSLSENRIATIDREIERLQAEKKKLQDYQAEKAGRTEEISEEDKKSFTRHIAWGTGR